MSVTATQRVERWTRTMNLKVFPTGSVQQVENEEQVILLKHREEKVKVVKAEDQLVNKSVFQL